MTLIHDSSLMFLVVGCLFLGFMVGLGYERYN